MLVPLTRRGLFARSLAALLAWAGLRPTPATAAPACPHPLHQRLCAERPGPGLWFQTYLRLTCPLCHETVHQRGYLPDTAYATSRAVVPPDWPADTIAAHRCTTYTYDTGTAAPPPLPPALQVTTFVYDSTSRGSAPEAGPS
jgi:hypothetical protein